MTTLRLEDLRRRVRSLARYIDKSTGRVIYTDFTDQLDASQVTTHDLVGSSGYGLGAYRKRMEQYIRSQQHYITISKLRLNLPITPSETDTLEQMLFSQGSIGTKEDFQLAYGAQPLGTFIRRIVGLDRSAAKEAFAGFINQPALNASQIRFVNTLIDYLTVNGVIEKSALFEPPFTDIASNGLTGVFGIEQATQIVRLVEKVNGNAVAV